MSQLITSELRSGEKVLWQGQPDRKVDFTKSDLFLVPFSLLWGGFAITWEFGAAGLLAVNKSKGVPVPFLFPFFGIPFVLMSLYFIFGRFVVKRKKKARTWYAVTNQRIIIATNFLGQKIESVEIKLLSTISKTIRSDGIGTLTFGNMPMLAAMYANTGMEFLGGASGSAAPAFYDIQNAAEVYKIIQEAR